MRIACSRLAEVLEEIVYGIAGVGKGYMVFYGVFSLLSRVLRKARKICYVPSRRM